MRIQIINGSNMNLLGTREPKYYGTKGLEDIQLEVDVLARDLMVETGWFQSNIEGEIVNFIHESARTSDGYVIAPAGFTHTSLSIRETFIAVEKPFVEIHLSNLAARAKHDEFRRVNLFSDAAVGVIYGFREETYVLGLRALQWHLTQGS